ALRQLLRDPVLLLAVIAQPVFLGLLVVLTQYDVVKPFPILFFAVVIATWLGLNNSARDLVRERRQYVRDRLTGLRPFAYLGAKTLVHALLGLAQIAVLLIILHVGCSLVLDRPVYQDLRSVSLERAPAMIHNITADLGSPRDHRLRVPQPTFTEMNSAGCLLRHVLTFPFRTLIALL